VDERDVGMQPRVLFFLEHAIQDATLARAGERRVISKRMLYVEMSSGRGTSRGTSTTPPTSITGPLTSPPIPCSKPF
jgi:hypothetical protein